MKRKCEYDYCIYNKKSICILEEIQMDCIGMCTSCIMVAIPKEKLEKYKNDQLKEIMRRYESYAE